MDSRLERQARNEALIREVNERIEQIDKAVAPEDGSLRLSSSASAVKARAATFAAQSGSR